MNHRFTCKITVLGWLYLVLRVYASHTVGCGFASWQGHTKDHHNVCLLKRSGSVWNSLWGHVLKRSPGINRKSRVLYPSPGFLSSATWAFAVEKAL